MVFMVNLYHCTAEDYDLFVDICRFGHYTKLLIGWLSVMVMARKMATILSKATIR